MLSLTPHNMSLLLASYTAYVVTDEGGGQLYRVGVLPLEIPRNVGSLGLVANGML